MVDQQGTAAASPDPVHITTSTRDLDALGVRLTEWLGTKLPDSEPVVSALQMPSANGMSSETVLFDAVGTENGERVTHELVAPLAPDPANMPVFRDYDMPRQCRMIQVVEQRSSVPVPHTYWAEGDSVAIGSPFFVMDRIS